MDETAKGASGLGEAGSELAADPGRHPRPVLGFDVLSEAGWWDETTRSLVVGGDRRRPPIDGAASSEIVRATRAPAPR